jgi:hypothetical protein
VKCLKIFNFYLIHDESSSLENLKKNYLPTEQFVSSVMIFVSQKLTSILGREKELSVIGLP